MLSIYCELILNYFFYFYDFHCSLIQVQTSTNGGKSGPPSASSARTTTTLPTPTFGPRSLPSNSRTTSPSAPSAGGDRKTMTRRPRRGAKTTTSCTGRGGDRSWRRGEGRMGMMKMMRMMTSRQRSKKWAVMRRS